MRRSSLDLRSCVISVLRSPYFWAVMARIAVYAALYPLEFRGDAGDYHVMAANLAEGHGLSRCPVAPFPLSAQRPPLYSIVLAFLYWLGVSPYWAPLALNLGFDLLSIRLIKPWGREAELSPRTLRAAQWLVAFCPLLLGYVSYPTTENLSIALFLGASYGVFRLGRERAQGLWVTVPTGLAWGLLALCRSYFLLFPWVLLVLPPSKRMKRSALAVMVAASCVAPGIWAARNAVVFGKPSFSQGAGVGWQSYQGLCFANFDWWNMEDAQHYFSHPILSKMLGSSCTPDQTLAELDAQVRKEVIEDCVLERPASAAFNVLAKGVMLFINWGQTLPYTQIPSWIRWPINAAVAAFWWCVATVFFARVRRRRVTDPARALLIYSGLGLAYVVAVTLPFSVDARYLLGPFLITACAALELAGGLAALIRSGLFLPSRSSPSGSHTP